MLDVRHGSLRVSVLSEEIRGIYGVLMVQSSHLEMKLLVLDEIAICEFGLFELLRYLNQYDSLIV